ncbi:NLR family CARD domain-containing protein 3-like isoform X2 [Cololabis saira]|uniref:NLR family CARD domain-containing protein 3-like isoform X2 n=1 Tax=Cololabis saira TaxID=129043 RepID=UPI002AD25DE0|nr:NLR family CARD domain-containing protein 3-like isoform X2 [Cololabis saira]
MLLTHLKEVVHHGLVSRCRTCTRYKAQAESLSRNWRNNNMGSQCSSLRRDKTKRDNKTNQKKEEVSDTEHSPLLQRQTLQDKGEHLEARSVNETPCSQAGFTSSEQNDFSESLANEYTFAGVHNPSPCLSDSESYAAEQKEADWVDNNRADLIQNITEVMRIADLMLQRGVIHKEMYNRIKSESVAQDGMREIFSTTTCTKSKSAFYRILQEIHPEISPKDFIKEVIKRNKEYLREKCSWQLEGTGKSRDDEKPLDKIYTELHIVQGENEDINKQHEIWEIEDKSRNQTGEEIKINCNNIFNTTPENTASSKRDERQVKTIRTVMTKGIAGIGKTVSVKKFILDWADGRANQDLDFIFMFPFRELNLVIDEEFSLEELVREFHPQLSDKAPAIIFSEIKTYKVLFIFDGLDESQLKLKFKDTKRLSEPSKKSSVDTLVTNLIREHLLPSALVWITSRPGAVQRIPREYVYLWTEVRGFNDPQKILYFRNRVEDKDVAERIINLITMSRSLYIMCHIPIFCWIASKVLEYLLLKSGNIQDETIKTPTTLTEMFSHFFLIQMTVATDKYDEEEKTEAEEIFKSNEEFISRLGRMAFEKLEKGEIIFSGEDLKKYGIDMDKAGVYCGFCTAIFKVESVFNTKKLYCFVHLTIQEYFSALFVYRSLARKSIESPILKNFVQGGTEEDLESVLDEDPVNIPLQSLVELTICNSAQRTGGELDMFLRFLIGLSLQSTQELLYGLIQQTEEHSEVVEEIVKSLTEMDLNDCSPERCLNLVHCLVELKDTAIHDAVQRYLAPNQSPETHLSPVQCSALADSILMSTTPLEEFDLLKFRPKLQGKFRLLPAMRNSRKVRISGVNLNPWTCGTISSALQMPNSVLTQLHLVNNIFIDDGVEILTSALINIQCKLEAFSLSGDSPSELLTKLEPVSYPLISNLRELELSDMRTDSLYSMTAVGLNSPKLEKLRLNRNPGISKICKELATAFTVKPSNLLEVELSYTNFDDTEMEVLSGSLTSANCKLKALSLSHNKLTVKGCEILASALNSRPSPLRELDLSYNDLYASGLMELCKALINQHCVLETLRLSFCKVTGDECSSVASALRSDHCKLRELDLSFNYLTDQHIKLLTEIQEDSRCSLENLNVEHNEECWVDLKLLRQYACDLTLDRNTAGKQIIAAKQTASYINVKQMYDSNPDRFDATQVLCEEGLTGRHYWEVECDSDSCEVGVAYKSIARDGQCLNAYSIGRNEKSWCWKTDGSFYHNNSPQIFLVSNTRNIGVYLEWAAGILSFFEVFPETLTHLYTVHTTFTEPLHPCFGLDCGYVSLRKIHKE